MKTLRTYSMLLAVLLLSACSITSSDGTFAEQSKNSHRAILAVTLENDTMTVSLTNKTKDVIELDGEMEILFDYYFVGGNDELEFLPADDGGEPLSKRLIKLSPGDTYTKVFKSGDLRHEYSLWTGISVDGRTHLNEMHVTAYRLPNFSQLDGIAVTYASGGSQARIPMELAGIEKVPTPRDLLDAAVSVEVRKTKKYVFPGMPYELRGDKDLPQYQKP